MFSSNRKTLVSFFASFLAMLLIAGAQISAAQEIRSGDGKVAVKLDPATDRRVVYELAGGKEWYSVPNLAGRMFLSEDGSYTATCHHWLGPDYRTKDVVVQFYRTGSAIKGLSLGELVERPKDLPHDASYLRWGQCEGFIGGSRFSLDTAEGRRIGIDLATGERFETQGVWPPRPMTFDQPETPPEPPAAPVPPTDAPAPPYPTPLDGHAIQPSALLTASTHQPDAFCSRSPAPVFCDDFVGNYKPGWQQVRGKWVVRNELALGDTIFTESVVGQRSEREREGNALLYYDNQSFSDVDITTVVRMDLSPPRLETQEDAAQIKKLRYIAGAGIVFRFKDEKNFYMFRLAGEEGAVLGKVVNGEWFDLANPRALDFLGRRLDYTANLYGLRVRVEAERIYCFLYEWPKDGRPEAEQAVIQVYAYDETGYVGRAGLVTFEAQADFLYFRVDGL